MESNALTWHYAAHRSAYFCVLDAVAAGAGAATTGVDTGGAALLCGAVGEAGEAAAFGDAGGFVHLFVRACASISAP